MGSLNKWVASLCASAVILLAQVVVSQWMWMSHMSSEMSVSNEARRIANEQIQDLMMQLENVKNERLMVGTQQFVAGVVAATQKPDYYTEIWHDGYDRGVAVQTYAAEMDKQAAYTKNKDIKDEER